MRLASESSSIDFAISHNRDDSQLAIALLLKLEAAGLAGWIDSRAFYSPLISAERQIERAFRKARFLCLLVSERYRDSTWCREEYKLGLRSEADLLMNRVLVIVENDAATTLVPETLKRAPRFNCASLQGLAGVIVSGRNNTSQLAEWADREIRGRAALVTHLPPYERIKLVGDHLEYLLVTFANGAVNPLNHESALKLGLTAGPPTSHMGHASPAVAMEMCWRWISDIVGKYRLAEFLTSDNFDDVTAVHISEIKSLFERMLPIFHDYLVKAAERRSPPNTSEADLFSIIDYVIKGFLAVICKAKQCDEALTDGVRQLLNVVVRYGDTQCAKVAEYLDAGLPLIGLPMYDTSRIIHIYRILRGARNK